MSHQTPVGNPFMLMLNPEVILAAMENSSHLNQLNRHLCRPLDRPAPATPAAGGRVMVDDDDEEEHLVA